jgi:acyl-CoA thioesterase FadM
MKPSIRLLKVLTAVTWKRTRDPAARPSADNPHAETVTRWRVMPGDLDLFGHMNNSRYLMLMDFARLDYLAHMGLVTAAFRRRWIVPVGTAQVDFYRPLKPFEGFEIGTQVLSWNHRWFFMRQTFRSRQCPTRPVATAYVKTIFCSPSGHVAPKDVVRLALGHDVEAPTMPDHLWARFRLGRPAAVVTTRVEEPHPRAPMDMGDKLVHRAIVPRIQDLAETLPA